jgi:hypothetical protein
MNRRRSGGALIAVSSSLLQIKGIELGADMQADLADIAVTLAGAAGGLLAIYGRLTAATGIRENSRLKVSITDHSFAIQQPLAT